MKDAHEDDIQETVPHNTRQSKIDEPLATYGDASWLFGGLQTKPPGYGFGLPVVYGVWLMVIVVLYPLCHWFAGVKQRRRDWWLSYL